MIKDIAVLLDTVGERAAPCAVPLAADLDAYLTGICLVPKGFSAPLPDQSVLEDMPDGVREEVMERVLHPGQVLHRDAAKAGVRVEITTVLDEAGAWKHLAGQFAVVDIVVVEQPQPNRGKPADAHLDAVLLQSGRPVLVVPYVLRPVRPFKTVSAAWDGSAAAGRALADALPLLRRAERVEVVRISPTGDSADRHGETRLIRHLERHGVDATYHDFATGLSVANALLNHVSDAGTDLLVMGAYGHSRMREAILGGVTREILRSTPVPVLMAH